MSGVMIEITEENIKMLGDIDVERLGKLVAAELLRRHQQKVNDVSRGEHAQPAGPTATSHKK
jgi:hypothetical protein